MAETTYHINSKPPLLIVHPLNLVGIFFIVWQL